jgi:hypothetical protein
MMSALAPGASRPRSSRPRWRAPPEGGGVEHVLGPADPEAAVGEAARQGRPAHLMDQVLGIRVGAERDVDPERAVALERLEGDAHPPWISVRIVVPEC